MTDQDPIEVDADVTIGTGSEGDQPPESEAEAESETPPEEPAPLTGDAIDAASPEERAEAEAESSQAPDAVYRAALDVARSTLRGVEPALVGLTVEAASGVSLALREVEHHAARVILELDEDRRADAMEALGGRMSLALERQRVRFRAGGQAIARQVFLGALGVASSFAHGALGQAVHILTARARAKALE